MPCIHRGLGRLLALATTIAGLAAASAAAAPAERAVASFGSDGAVLNLTVPVPGQVPNRSVSLSCVGPDVLIHVDMMNDGEVAAWLAESPAMVLLVDGEPVRFAFFNLGFDVYYGWVAALYYDGSGPADWLDRLAGAAAIVALNPLDRFAFPATDDARAALDAFARQCAAERFGLDPSSVPVAGEGRAVFYEPTRLRRDRAWQPTITTPATVDWTVTGSGRGAVLSVAVAASEAGTAAEITITPGPYDPDEVVFAVRLTGERWRSGMDELGFATDGPGILRAVTEVRSDRVGMEWSDTVRLAALRDLFAGGLVYLGRRDPLLDPSLVIDPGDLGRSALAAALVAWGMR